MSELTVHLCGPQGPCGCKCPDGPCGHDFSVKEVRADGCHYNCFKCGMSGMDHDIWVMP